MVEVGCAADSKETTASASFPAGVVAPGRFACDDHC